ncbi:MAG TPA: glycosyltransferase family 4 protein [Candidatus Limnocylindrales bacterium]|nr:glycosyltransferase family 4 protein [Candidatus Limnocylindrales bacterium]
MNAIEYTHAGGSGAARYVANLAGALAAQGIAVDLVCPNDFAYTEELTGSGVRIVMAPRSLAGARGPVAKLGRAALQSIVGAWRAGRLPNESRLVHMNFVGIPLLALPVIVWLRLRGRRVILTVHDVLPHRPLLGDRLTRAERVPLAVLYRSADHLVVHYASAGRQLRREFGIREAQVTVIPHGADVRAAAPPLGAATDAPLRLAVLGAIRPNKGVHLAIEAVQELRRRGRPIELTIAGQPGMPDADYWRTCQALIDRSPDGFHVTPTFLSDSEMRARLSESDAVLLPYDAFDAQSGVAVDAISSGRAIIATRVGGLEELVERSGAGIPIESASPDAVCASIEEALRLGRSGLATLGAAGIVYARDHLSWQKVAGLHVLLYRQVAATP